jgi:1,4-alpha-glucan branching enzyme
VSRRARGELAIVLHTHLPYVEGFGTWPFGEEWLWEAMATSYLPLLAALEERHPGGGAPLTLSITPVLADQLEAGGVPDRFRAFLRDIRTLTHQLELDSCRSSGAHELMPALEHSARAYARAGEQFDALGGDLLGALAPHVSWTSSATHAIIPLLATDAGVRLQLGAGAAAHRRRFGGWGGGLWLPECAHAPWLEPRLEEAGVHAACVDLTDVFGLGDPAHLRPLQSASGPLLVPIDRATHELAWSGTGYPAAGAYRDHHRLTTHHHRAWANTGAPYDPAAGQARARADAADFVARVGARLDGAAAELGRPGLCVCAMDTEFLGHWWHEGVDWLAAVLDEAPRAGLALSGLDDALARCDPAPAPPGLPATSWGEPRTLATWDSPAVADLAWQARAAELRVVRAGAAVPERAARELLALQSSDWAWLAARGTAGAYPRERANAHAAALHQALRSPDRADPRLRSLAPDLALAPLLEP